MSYKLKITIIVSVLLAGVNSCPAQSKATGISFYETKWEDVLKKAQKTGKLIMVDVYTTWCAPCKRMDSEVFLRPDVGEKFNASFICFRADAEKGVGVAIKKRYQVAAYPTYLFISGDGMLVHRGVGYHAPADFLQLANVAISKINDKENLKFLQKQYASGDREHAFLQTYIKKLAALGLKHTQKKILDEFVSSLSEKDLCNTQEIGFILRHLVSSDSKAFSVLIDRQPLAAKALIKQPEMYGDIIRKNTSSKLQAILHNALMESIMIATSTKDSVLMERVISDYGKLASVEPMTPYTFFAFSMQFYKTIRDTSNLINIAKTFLNAPQYFRVEKIDELNKLQFEQFMYQFETGIKDSSIVKNFQQLKKVFTTRISLEAARSLDLGARTFSRVTISAEYLAQAISWSREAISLVSDEPSFHQTLAELYYKTNQHDMAVSSQQRAADIAQKQMMNKDVIEKFNKVLNDMRAKNYKSN